MSDVEATETTNLIPEPPVEDAKNFKKLVLLVSLVSFALIGSLALAANPFSSTIAKDVKLANFQETKSKIVHTKGKQPVVKGCVNIYGSDYRVFPDTDALVVCESNQMNTDTIDSYGFAPWDQNHGVTFIETGEKTSITLFLGKDFQGFSKTIPQNSAVLLTDVPLPKGAKGSPFDWNDKVQSLVISNIATKTEALTSDAEVYLLPEVDNASPGPGCVLLYGSDPITHPKTTGVMACAGTSKDTWSFSGPELLQDYKIALMYYSGGTSYIRTGAKASITLYSGQDPENCIYPTCHTTTIGSGKSQDLTLLPYGNSHFNYNNSSIQPQVFSYIRHI